MSLKDAAIAVRENAYTPDARFKVVGALRSASRTIFVRCNVENLAYPEGTCVEAGAIAAMGAAGETKIVDAYVVAGAPRPITPCGGCRQKLAEFAEANVPVTMATTSGVEEQTIAGVLLPGTLTTAHMGT